MCKPSWHRLGAGLAAALLSAARLAAADETVITQPPAHAPAQVRSGAAPPAGVFAVPPSFRVERLFTVPGDRLGSWVCMTFDDKGRLIVSDEADKGLCRVTPPRLGSGQPTRVERLGVNITAAQGLLYAFGSLYVTVNRETGSGLYRVRDTDGDDRFDEVVKLTTFDGHGDHGPHGLRLTPDGRSILVVCGNHTDPPAGLQISRLPRNWGEDLLLPRLWDPNGHARGRLAPGGWVARTDPDGKLWELIGAGHRNPYDLALNADGELFTYDADMEWDIGTPWYRPSRVAHVTSGSEFGWRSGSGKWPPYYPDSLPPALDVGPGSPVGITFGYGAKFPARYQKALFMGDWTYGTIHAVHLEPDGSTYRAILEDFLSRTPLPVTDVAVGPDGALYFTTGGRGAQSELFRVTYTGDEPTAPADARDPRHADLRALRHRLETYHAPAADAARAVDSLYPYLGHPDRFIRYAARVGLEHQPVGLWHERVLAETDPERLIGGAIALARQGKKSLQPRLLAALGRLDLAALPEGQALELLRAYALTFTRLGEPDRTMAAGLVRRFDAHYPTPSDALNRELSTLLVYLKSPTVVAKTVALMRQGPRRAELPGADALLARNYRGGVLVRTRADGPDPQHVHYAFVLRTVLDGWTTDERAAYFRWLGDASQRSGGNSFRGFIQAIERDAFETAPEVDRRAIEAAGLRIPYRARPLPKPKGPGRDWTADELTRYAESRLSGRNYRNGKQMFAAARCVVCHRFNDEGGATGPDLTQLAGRFTLKDLAEAIVEPSKVVPDLYRASVVTTRDGRVLTGRVVGGADGGLTVLTDAEDPTKVVEIRKDDVEEVKASPVSLMPEGLLKPLNETEILDLFAYLLSRGDATHTMFRK
jgi:putative heme-binding domain-containing protein